MFRHLPLRTIGVLSGSAHHRVCVRSAARGIDSLRSHGTPGNAAGGRRRPRACSARMPGWFSTLSNRTRPPISKPLSGKLREALQKSDSPERKQQAASWKVFRAVEPGANGSVLYIFDIDPAVKGADYTVSTILAEAFPADVQALYKQYADAYASGQNFVNLTLVAASGE